MATKLDDFINEAQKTINKLNKTKNSLKHTGKKVLNKLTKVQKKLINNANKNKLYEINSSKRFTNNKKIDSDYEELFNQNKTQDNQEFQNYIKSYINNYINDYINHNITENELLQEQIKKFNQISQKIGTQAIMNDYFETNLKGMFIEEFNNQQRFLLNPEIDQNLNQDLINPNENKKNLSPLQKIKESIVEMDDINGKQVNIFNENGEIKDEFSDKYKLSYDEKTYHPVLLKLSIKERVDNFNNLSDEQKIRLIKDIDKSISKIEEKNLTKNTIDSLISNEISKVNKKDVIDIFKNKNVETKLNITSIEEVSKEHDMIHRF